MNAYYQEEILFIDREWTYMFASRTRATSESHKNIYKNKKKKKKQAYYNRKKVKTAKKNITKKKGRITEKQNIYMPPCRVWSCDNYKWFD